VIAEQKHLISLANPSAWPEHVLSRRGSIFGESNIPSSAVDIAA